MKKIDKSLLISIFQNIISDKNCNFITNYIDKTLRLLSILEILNSLVIISADEYVTLKTEIETISGLKTPKGIKHDFENLFHLIINDFKLKIFDENKPSLSETGKNSYKRLNNIILLIFDNNENVMDVVDWSLNEEIKSKFKKKK